jgi:RNA polymerase sigma-70 factor (sigma-E family)
VEVCVGFEEFLAARLSALLRYASALTGDRHRAEDIVQTVLARAERRWRRISRMDAPEAYLKRMITNEFLSWRRLRSSQETPVPDQTIHAASVPVSDHAQRHADRDEVWAGITGLPPKQRVALALRYYEDLSYGEIASILGCSEATVRSHVSRALATLRVDLSEPVTEEAR